MICLTCWWALLRNRWRRNKPSQDWIADCMKWRGRVLDGPDAHWCMDWDELPVDAFTPEYDCCVCYLKTWLGRICNYFFMLKFNWYMRKAQRKEENELAKSSTNNRSTR